MAQRDDVDILCNSEISPVSLCEERFDYVRPTKQLLDFYRLKIVEYENEHDSFVKRLGEYKTTYEESHQLECEIKQRESEIGELQKALSDMQVFLFKEREQVLGLYKDNDTLKARDLENKRTIQQLLALQGGTLDSEISYFFKEPPEQPIIPNKTGYRESENMKYEGRNGKAAGKVKKTVNRLKQLEEADQVTLMLQTEALQSQISDQSRWAREFLEALNEDRQIKLEEFETRRDCDLEKLKVLSEKLHKTQDLLYQSTQDILKTRREWKETEKAWLLEKDKLVLELDTLRGRMNIPTGDKLDVNISQLHSSHNLTSKYRQQSDGYKLDCKKIRQDIEESRRMSEMYRQQVISLEDEIAGYKSKEHLATDIYKTKTENISKRYQIMKARYEDLEKRRNLEVEGFKNDVKFLRKQLKDMERQLYKATLQLGVTFSENKPTDYELAVLYDVTKSVTRSEKLSGKLKVVKEKVYELEQDMKHL